MPLGLYPQESINTRAELLRGPHAGMPEPSFGAGFFGTIPSGFESAAAKTAALAADALAAGAADTIRYAQANVPEAAQQAGLAAPLMELQPDEIEYRTKQATEGWIKSFQPNPRLVGTAGQIMHSVIDVGSRFVAGSVVGGPVAGAALAGGTEGYATKKDMEAQGIDSETANKLAAANALFTGAGALLPGGVGGSLAKKLVSGAAINEVSGMGSRSITHEILADAGYKQQAEQYRVLDAQAMSVDAVLGAAFGGIAHRFHVKQDVIDSAHITNDALHIDTDLAPGLPVDTQARNAHVDNLVSAARSLMNDEPVSVDKPVDSIRNPIQEEIRAKGADEISQAVNEAAEPLVGVHTPPVVEPEQSNRLSELRTAKQARELTQPELNEYTSLLEKDRVQAKVGGKIIQGVLNDDAYAETMARGETLPVQGFVDLDMLKTVNDTMGHSAGDHAIRELGESLARVFDEGNVFRRSSSGAGDEFIVQSKTPAEHEAKIAAARQYLDNVKLRAYDKAGNLIAEKKGVGFSHGSGRTVELAEQAAYADKRARAVAGLRSDRGAVAEKPGVESSARGSDKATGTEAKSERVDPETQEAIDTAQAALEAHPDIQIENPETGQVMSGKDAIQQALDGIKDAQQEGVLHQIAAACFGRM
jgi:diguanylate cyclase (GGDEF)-like protein